MAQKVPFKRVLDALLDDSQPFPSGYLVHFSDLEPTGLKAFAKVWPKVSARRKHTLLEDLEGLAEADTLVCFDNLARTLLTDTDPEVRVLAMRLLWECDDPKLVPLFLNLLNQDEDGSARAAAATALGHFVYLGELEEIPAQVSRKVEDDLLVAAKTDKDTLVRQRAIESLGVSSRPEVPPLIEAAYEEKNPAWKASALFAMGKSGETSWGKHVLAHFRNHDEDIRTEAIRAAGELSLRSARPALLDMLEDEDSLEMRHEITWALSKIGGEGVRERLEELLETEKDDEEAEFLEEALSNLDLTEDTGLLSMFDFDADDQEE